MEDGLWDLPSLLLDQRQIDSNRLAELKQLVAIGILLGTRLREVRIVRFEPSSSGSFGECLKKALASTLSTR